MAKFLFIWHNRLYDKSTKEQNIKGGTEQYLAYLIEYYLSKGHEIDFIYLHDDEIFFSNKHNSLENKINFIKIKPKKNLKKIKNFHKQRSINFFIHFFNFFRYHKNVNTEYKAINLYLKKNFKYYNYIINNITCIFSKKIRNYDGMFFVQHTDASLYEKCFNFNKLNFKNFSIIYKFIFLFIYKSLFFDKNCLRKYKNVVFYSDAEEYKKINKCVLVGSVPIDSFSMNEDSNKLINEKKNNSILYFGRFDNESKNLKLLNRISKEGNFNMDLFGFGDYKTELKKNFLFNLKGKIKTSNEKINILSKYDIFLLTSNYEGICMSAIELLSMGVIGIIRNTFLEAKNLIPVKHHRLLLINSNASVKEYIDKINFIKNLELNKKNEIRIDLMEHIKNNYSLDKFLKNWNDILKTNNNN